MTGWLHSLLTLASEALGAILTVLRIRSEHQKHKETIPKGLSNVTILKNDIGLSRRAIDWQTPKAFKITQNLFIQLRKIDPTIPVSLMDDELSYVHNNVESDTCVVFLSGLGLDYRDFLPYVCEYDAFHCIGICLHGFQPGCTSSTTLSLDTHIRLLASVVNHAISSRAFATICLAGFSIGADIGLRLLNSDPLQRKFHGFLGLDPNLNADTQFISGKIAGINIDGRTSLSVVKELSRDKFNTLQEWLNIHFYLTKVFEKFREDRCHVLQNVAHQMTEWFPGQSVDPFIATYSRACGQVERLKFAFSDYPAHWELVDVVKGRLADDSSSVAYRDDSLKVHRGMDHFSLINNTAFLHEQLVSVLSSRHKLAR